MLTKKLMPWRLEEVSRNVHVLRFDDVRDGWEQYVLLQSDEHWDNPHCKRELYAKHLGEAVERRAPVIKYGDLFCAMQGKWDKRSNKNDVRPEHQNGDYLDSLVTTAAEWHRPYAEVIAVVGAGNHETGVLKHHETNLTERFTQALRTLEPSSPVRTGGFSGWVRFMFTIQGTQRQSQTLWYHHGYGGGGPVTRDVIQSSRRAVYADADIICTGHTHDEWVMPIRRIRLSHQGVIQHVEQLHIKTPGYKEEYGDGFGGFHIERGGPPKPTGAIWLRFYYEGKKVHVEPRRAQ
jgi:predicted phosphodiesterase